MSKVYLCSFADMRLCVSAYRFYKQARLMDTFDEIFIYNETNFDLCFRNKIKNRLYDSKQERITRVFVIGYRNHI